MADIKQMLENWQKMLDVVINSKLSNYFNLDSHHIEIASQEVMGSNSKINLLDRDSLDDDQFGSDSYKEYYNDNWQNINDFETEDKRCEISNPFSQYEQDLRTRIAKPDLSTMSEETSSQMETKESKSKSDVTDINIIELQ